MGARGRFRFQSYEAKEEEKIKLRQHEASQVSNEAHSRTVAFSREGTMLTKVEKELCRAQGGRLDGRAAKGKIVQVRVDDIGEAG